MVDVRVTVADGRVTVAGGRVAAVDDRETGAGGKVEEVTVLDHISLFIDDCLVLLNSNQTVFQQRQYIWLHCKMGRKDYLKACIVQSTLVHVCRTSVIFSGCMFYILLKHLPGALSFPFRLPFFPFFLEGGDKGCGGACVN